MLIITNPPFGYKAALSRKILTQLKEVYSDQIVCMQPYNGFKPYTKDLLDMAPIKQEFGQGMNLKSLVVGRVKKGESRSVEYLQDCMVRGYKDESLYKALKEYNKDKEACWAFVSNNEIYREEDKDDKDFAFTYRQMDDQYIHNPYFRVPARDPIKSLAHDVRFNIYGILDEVGAMYIFRFNNLQQKLNFTKWYYSGASSKQSLPNRIYKLKQRVKINQKATKYFELFPKVDWNREWTDEEILKEIRYCE